jgi:hypothetical protein
MEQTLNILRIVVGASFVLLLIQGIQLENITNAAWNKLVLMVPGRKAVILLENVNNAVNVTIKQKFVYRIFN